MNVPETIGEYRAQWGEGPIWYRDRLLYVDIEKHKVISFDPEGGGERIWNVGRRVGTVVPRRNGGLLIAGDDGILMLDEESGRLEAVVDPEAEKRDNRFNDGKCSPDGRFFAGTISLVKKEGDARLYRLDPDLSLHVAHGPVTNSNGIGWSKDGLICYYIDTPTRAVVAFDYDRETGGLANLRKVVDTGHIEASPDGMAIDSENRLWVAFCHGACVAVFDPGTGKEVERIGFPCLETTALAFGGSKLQDLYVTTGVHKSEKEEHAGRLFVVRDVGVTGLPGHAFAG